jgi:hypothetical protein
MFSTEFFMSITTTATITKPPQTIGSGAERQTVLYVEIPSGDQYSILRNVGDPEVIGFQEGDLVEISIDETNRADILPKKQMGFEIVSPPIPTKSPTESARSLQIKQYVVGLGKVYGHCYTTAKKQVENTGLAQPEINDVATTLFIQTVRHFNI